MHSPNVLYKETLYVRAVSLFAEHIKTSRLPDSLIVFTASVKLFSTSKTGVSDSTKHDQVFC